MMANHSSYFQYDRHARSFGAMIVVVLFKQVSMPTVVRFG